MGSSPIKNTQLRRFTEEENPESLLQMQSPRMFKIESFGDFCEKKKKKVGVFGSQDVSGFCFLLISEGNRVRLVIRSLG